MEDDEDPPIQDTHFLRSCNHFYAVAHIPVWLTDDTEIPFGVLPDDRTGSFVWATSPGMQGPHLRNTYAGPNHHTWQDARNWQLQALTLTTKVDREAALALGLYALGHVLHLNQDLSQPDHVRNDEHVPKTWKTRKGKHWIEDYGLHNYFEESRNANTLDQTFPLRARGWQSWRMAGFQRLEDFWDRGLYTGQNSSALSNDEAATWPPQSPPTTQQLGLAEFSNGNFLGEDATYGDLMQVGEEEHILHYFPFPSLWTSTTFKRWVTSAVGVAPVTFRNGLVGNRLYIHKPADGQQVRNHSALTNPGAKAGKSVELAALKKLITIHDDNVLQEYHAILIPKAIEYSAGILDYFFRGQLGALAYRTNSGAIFLEVTNTSGQRLSGGTFEVYADADGTRSSVGALQPAWGSSETLEDGATRDFTFAEPTPPPTNYVVLYRGTIGTGDGPSYSALDSVDATIAVAAKSFYLPTPGNVIALHTMLGRPPFRHSDIHSASDTTTDAGGWADHTATAPDLTWMAGFCDWLAGFGDDPGYDPDDVVNGYYQVSELKVTVNFDDGGDAVVYDHIAKVGPHTGVWPGTVVYEFATAWDTVLGWGQEYTYQLNDDGTHWTVGNKDNFASPSASVTEAIPT
jgi:hypothetical protein